MKISAKNIFRLKFCLLLLAILSSNVLGQSGGSYQMTSSVISSGGETSAGGSFTVESTIGEPAAETLLRNPPYSLQSGFMPTTLTFTPTAADSVISGRITAPSGAPVAGVVVTLGGGKFARTITDGNGSYGFQDLETGEFYTVTPSMANLTFSPSSLGFSLVSNKTDAVFVANAIGVLTSNALDTEMFFVRQHYLDFLGREPDAGGLNYWTSQIENCSPKPQCINNRRIGVSAAFFIETEFQQTGSFVYRIYKGALGRQVSYPEFSSDRQQVVAGANLDQSKSAFLDAFVQRPEFIQKYQQATSAERFVDALLNNIWQASAADLGAERSLMIELYKTGRTSEESRASVIRYAIEDRQFRDVEYNRAFVLMQYFGYLRRDPDAGGYLFWLNVLNNKEPNNYRGMVCSFLTSAEYQKRFSSVVTHTNSECRQ